MTALSLYREIDALGGTADNDLERGYVSAITDVLEILERRGFSERTDAPQHNAELKEANGELLAALVKLDRTGREAWHFQHQDTNAQIGFATALAGARAIINKAGAA